MSCNFRPIWFDYGTRRYVAPYYYEMEVRCKGRWVGKLVVDVFTAEFSHHSEEYYRSAVKRGDLRVEVRRQSLKRARPATASAGDLAAAAARESVVLVRSADVEPLQRNDVIVHRIHRHELSVFRTAVPSIATVSLSGCGSAVEMDPLHGLLVVNKPPSLPTHSSGRYHYNSCVSMINCWLSCLGSEEANDISGSSGGSAAEEEEEVPHTRDRAITSSFVDHRSLVRLAPSVTPSQRAALENLVAEARRDRATAVEVRACHRLDKSTSGVLLCSLNTRLAGRVSDLLARKTRATESLVTALLEGRKPAEDGVDGSSEPTPFPSVPWSRVQRSHFGIWKTYLARVEGEFPIRSGGMRRDGATTSFRNAVDVVAVDGPDEASFEWLIVAPLPVLQKHSCGAEDTNGSAAAAEDGDEKATTGGSSMQAAATLVRRLLWWPEVNHSVVECVPLTGRTHQLRRHLAHVGFPISNDAKYHPRFESQLSRLSHGDGSHAIFYDYSALPPEVQPLVAVDEHCYECNRILPVTSAGDAQVMLFLHAWKYEVALTDESEWRCFEAAPPIWALRSDEGGQ